MIANGGRRHKQAGFTLTELMVVVAIIALMAMLAVPALTKDRQDARFFKFVRTFAFDVRRAHMKAISTKDHRQFTVSKDRYGISAATKVPKTSKYTLTTLATRLAPSDVVIAGIMPISTMPGTSYPTPSGIGFAQSFRLLSTGGVQMEASSNYEDKSVTIFFKTSDNAWKARVVIFQATAHTKLYKSW